MLSDFLIENMGQNCCGGSRLFIEESIYESFLDLLAQKAAEIKMGNPLEPDVNFGPLGRVQKFRKRRIPLSSEKSFNSESVPL
jgi:acyl-CoA reductase-like NAD-dependent aldehyde dehydrogenase